MKQEDEKVLAFLKDLAAVSEKHGLVIEGCGCCGSPAVEQIDDKRTERPVVYAVDVMYTSLEAKRRDPDERYNRRWNALAIRSTD